MARTKGSKNIKDRNMNTVAPSRCKVCKSTSRAEYDGKRVLEYAGTDNDGQPYNRIVYRDTRCLNCNQARTDRTYEFEPPTGGNVATSGAPATA